MPRRKRPEAEEAADDEQDEQEDAASESSDLEEPAEHVTRWARDIHGRAYKPRSYLPVISNGIDEIWAADHCFMWSTDDRIVKENDGCKYALVCIDVFSKYLWVIPQKQINAAETVKAFKQIFEQTSRKPQKLWLDEGSAYISREFKAFATKHEFTTYHTHTSESKAVVAERANRTLRELLARTLTAHGTNRWVGAMLKQVLEHYNNEMVSRPIGMTPAAASKLDKAGQQALWLKLYGHLQSRRTQTPRFHVGQSVRISRLSTNVYEKRSNAPRWSGEVFTITEVIRGRPVTYKLIDPEDDQVMSGRFYESELQPAPAADSEDNVDIITEIVGERGTKAKREYSVKWFGHRKPTWVPAADITSQELLDAWKGKEKEAEEPARKKGKKR